jgi:hypothetical protein
LPPSVDRFTGHSKFRLKKGYTRVSGANEKITKNHHISGRCFRKPPLFEKVSKNNHSMVNTLQDALIHV